VNRTRERWREAKAALLIQRSSELRFISGHPTNCVPRFLGEEGAGKIATSRMRVACVYRTESFVSRSTFAARGP